MREYYCPLCKRKLVEKYDGFVCKNSNCELYWKLEKGWVLRTGEENWSRQRIMINAFYTSFSRGLDIKQWTKKKKEILIRDDYTCKKCGYKLPDGYYHENGLQVHHVIPVTEERALQYDNDNLITLCKRCHAEVHSLDKRSFTPNKKAIFQ